MKKIKYSVILPVYNEEKSLKKLNQRLVKVMSKLKEGWEIIFIDDGSTDGSFGEIKKLVEANARIKAIKLRKNLGKSMVYSCGFARAKGDIIFTLDSDLQDQPEEISKFINKLNRGFDFVTGWRVRRRDPFLKVVASNFSNRIISLLTGIRLHDFNCGFRAFRKETVSNLDLHDGLYRFLPVLVSRRGFKVGEVKVKHAPRHYGQSKYGWSKFPKAIFDLARLFRVVYD